MAIRTVPWTGQPQRVKTVTDYTAGNVDVVILDKGYPAVEVWVDDAATVKVWVTVDRGGANEQIIQPTVGGDGCFKLAGGGVRVIADDEYQAPLTTVRILSATGIAAYTVTGCNQQGN